MQSKILIRIISLILILSSGCTKSPTPETKEPEIKNIVIPVNIFKYDFSNATDLNSSLSLNDMKNYFQSINNIWAQANIEFSINSFKTVSINDQAFANGSYSGLTNRDFRLELEKMSETHIQTKSMTNEGLWSLVLIKKFPHPAGGVWSNKTEIVFFAQTKNGEKVIENILAHEFGHSLSLKHVNAGQFPDNLMKSGDGKPETATQLTETQIDTARQKALLFLKQ